MKLPQIPDDDADFTPDLARKIIAQYHELLLRKNADNSDVMLQKRERVTLLSRVKRFFKMQVSL